MVRRASREPAADPVTLRAILNLLALLGLIGASWGLVLALAWLLLRQAG